MMENWKWTDWVRWCLAGQSPSTIDATLLTLIDLSNRSKYRTPILAAHISEDGHTAAGYVVLYPGALGSLRTLRCCAQVDSGKPPATEQREREMLTSVVRMLCDAAFENGVQLVQAITLLHANRGTDREGVSFSKLDPARELTLASAGMKPVAKLIQMERNEARLPVTTLSAHTRELGFKPHDAISTREWHTIIEATYLESLDIPELNGLRNIEDTLEGYAASHPRMPRPWWVIQNGGENIGCLLLTPNDDQQCELTYLGLAPSSRGKGHARTIMDFVDGWVASQGIQRMTLAVDTRNIPAIRLYQSRGFVANGYVQAWIHVPDPHRDRG